MSSIISQGSGALTGLVSGAAGLVKSLTSQATLMQFEFNPDDGAYSAGNSNLILAFDCVMGDTFTQQSQPTAYAIEDASSITDHITRLPLQLDLVGIVTDTSIVPSKQLFTQEAVVTAATAVLPPLGVVGGSIGAGLINGTLHSTSDSNAARPSRKALQILNGLQVGNLSTSPPTPPKPFTAVSRMGRWTNMMIANLVVPRDQDTGDSLIFQISLVQVNVVKAQTVPLSVLNNPVLGGAKRTLGAQTSQEQTAAQTNQDAEDVANAGKAGIIKGRTTAGVAP